MQFKLLAFDLDDTVLDTFTVSIPNCVEMVNQEYGAPIKVTDWTKPNGYRGKAGQPLLDAIEADYGVRIALEPFMQKRREWLHHQIKAGLKPAPGFVDAIRELHTHQRRLCICTNSVAERAALSLGNAILEGTPTLAAIFGAHVYSAMPDLGPKPAPAVYLHAARVFGVDPSECLAVEDTPTGVQAALAAGYTTVGYVGLHDDPAKATEILFAAGAHHVMQHWNEFLPLLQKLEA
jgi:beta-phosphoglucomutase-like phosphatase (HAD superfamily)